ncbi:transcriptional regulator [Providencia alcalifaciens]
MVYLINNDIEFIYERNVLYSRKLNLEQSLLSPSSRILKYLIENNGCVITQSTLFQIGWEDKLEYVTNNAFYQNISLLRKAFEILNQKNKLIINFPKKGYSLDKNVIIEIITAPSDSISIIETAETIETAEIAETAETAETAEKNIKGTKKIRLDFLILITILIISPFYFYKSAGSNNDLYSYDYCGKNEGVNFFCEKNSIINDNQFRNIIDKIKKSKSKYNYIYFRKNIHNEVGYSFLNCKSEFMIINLTPNNCISYYAIEK